MSLAEQKVVLNGVTFLQFLDPGQLLRLYENGRVYSVNKGESIFTEGAQATSMFIVLDGCIEIFRENKRISIINAGDYFGEMAIIDDMPRSAGARGHQDSFVFEINKTQFKDILEASPPVVKAFLLTISQRSRVGLDIIDAGYMELIQSEERYRTMVQTISDIIIQVDNSGNISFINSSISRLGYDPTELIGKPLAQIIEMPDIADEADGTRKVLTRRVRDRATTNGEVNFIVKPDNSLSGLKETIPYLVNSHGMWDVKNDLVIEKNSPKSFQGTLLLAKNISQLKNEEMLLRKRKDQLETLVHERTEKLEKAIREAESANSAKSEFFPL